MPKKYSLKRVPHECLILSEFIEHRPIFELKEIAQNRRNIHIWKQITRGKMAPAFIIGEPQKSLVHIPGSGTDKHLKPISLEVGDMKRCATALSVITNFNLEIPPDEQSIAETIRNHWTINRAILSSRNETRSQNTFERAPARSTPKSSGRVYYLLRNVRLTFRERRKKYTELQENKKKLLEENAVLQQKVDKFKEIILSRSKLASFLATLREMEEEQAPPTKKLKTLAF